MNSEAEYDNFLKRTAVQIFHNLKLYGNCCPILNKKATIFEKIIVQPMTNIEKEVIEYFDDIMTYKTNKCGVRIYMYCDQAFSAACEIPGFIYPNKEYTIILFATFETPGKMIETFKMAKLADLENISPEMIYRLYDNGGASIHCSMMNIDSFGLCFTKLGSTLFAKDNIYENSHAVVPYLRTQEEFYNYTVDFYENVFNKEAN